MIRTLLRINWLNLKRDRIALGLTFVLPIVFFTIFAMIFGNMGGGDDGALTSQPIDLIVVDDDQSAIAADLIETLDGMDELRVRRTYRRRAGAEAPIEDVPYDRDTAADHVRSGHAPIAAIFPEGFGEAFGSFFMGEGLPVELIYDPANPIALPAVTGLMQGAAMQAAPEIFMVKGLEQLEQFGGALTPQQQSAVDTILPFLSGEKPWDELEGATDDDEHAGAAPFTGPIQVSATNVRQAPADADDDQPNAAGTSMVTYYAAGIGVMFLLFSMAGAAGSLLEEEEQGTLERVLTARDSMGGLLLGNWLFYTIMGALQLGVMFLFGALVFDLDLFRTNHLVGFIVVTLPTAAAGAAFGLLLATLCRSRAQLGGISTIVILIMSALGGSMVPKVFVPEVFNITSRFTFNGWALDAYLKVFWNHPLDESLMASLGRIGLELLVLVGMTIVFLGVARITARRWETV